jgi:predicted  nucleic acid-binding Zn-ribbon protein
MERKEEETPNLSILETVRCLECGFVYSKPAGGGTARQNPGCPECGYVGWLSTAVPVTQAFARRRSAVGRLQGPSAQPS